MRAFLLRKVMNAVLFGVDQAGFSQGPFKGWEREAPPGDQHKVLMEADSGSGSASTRTCPYSLTPAPQEFRGRLCAQIWDVSR